MPQVTLSTGQAYSLDSTLVLRIRRSLPSDALPIGKTRIDMGAQLQANEGPEAVAAAVKAELPVLVRFTTSDGSPVWTNARKAMAPWYVPPTNRTNGVQSAFMIANKVQYVTETPHAVADIIAAAGGTPLPADRIATPESSTDEPELPTWD